MKQIINVPYEVRYQEAIRDLAKLLGIMPNVYQDVQGNFTPVQPSGYAALVTRALHFLGVSDISELKTVSQDLQAIEFLDKEASSSIETCGDLTFITGSIYVEGLRESILKKIRTAIVNRDEMGDKPEWVLGSSTSAGVKVGNITLSVSKSNAPTLPEGVDFLPVVSEMVGQRCYTYFFDDKSLVIDHPFQEARFRQEQDEFSIDVSRPTDAMLKFFENHPELFDDLVELEGMEISPDSANAMNIVINELLVRQTVSKLQKPDLSLTV